MTIKTQWLLLALFAALPYLVLGAAGAWWLYDSGWWLWWIGWAALVSLSGWPLMNWLRKRSSWPQLSDTGASGQRFIQPVGYPAAIPRLVSSGAGGLGRCRGDLASPGDRRHRARSARAVDQSGPRGGRNGGAAIPSALERAAPGNSCSVLAADRRTCCLRFTGRVLGEHSRFTYLDDQRCVEAQETRQAGAGHTACTG